jgi:hypothetical protein
MRRRAEVLTHCGGVSWPTSKWSNARFLKTPGSWILHGLALDVTVSGEAGPGLPAAEEPGAP